MNAVSATITFEIEVTVQAEADQAGFDVVSINAVSGYDRQTRTHIMTGAFRPDQLAELVEKHFAKEAIEAIDEQAGEDRAAYLDGMADLAHERRMEAF
jgi:glucuronate isomerase